MRSDCHREKIMASFAESEGQEESLSTIFSE